MKRPIFKKSNSIIGIDPGQTGAIVYLWDGNLAYHEMPLKNGNVDFYGILSILDRNSDHNIFLERAIPFAQGVKAAFNYGRDFGILETALLDTNHAVIYVEPAKWTKAMHAGISADLKPKVKSKIAVERLFPKFVDQIPKDKKGNFHSGVMDALLIAAYGQRLLNGVEGAKISKQDNEDFF